MEFEKRSVVVKTFAAATQEIAAERFAADSVVATRLGYAATSQSWDGQKLTVVYQLQPSGESKPPDPPPAARAASNAQANQERAAANAMANLARAEANAQANQERAEGRDPVALPPPPASPPR